MQLTDPTRWVPITVVGFGAATAGGFYHWNEESQLLGLFALFCGTIYAKGGGAIAGMFDESSRAILTEQQALEDKAIDATKAVRDAHAANAGIDADLSSVMGAQAVLMAEVSAAKTNEMKHVLREQIVGNLEAIIELEEMNAARLQTEMVNSATEQVLAAWSAEGADKLKDAALAASLAALKDPTAKVASDTVGEMYVKSFADIRATAEANAGKAVELTPEQQAATADAVRALLSKRGLLPTEADLVEQGASAEEIAASAAAQAAALKPLTSVSL